MIDRRLFRSASFRFGLIYAVLLAASATALAMFLWWATAGLLDRQTEAAIRADAQGLSERWAEGGLPALVVTIEDRLAQNVDDDAIYFLADPQMRRLAGNLQRWPADVTETGVSYEFPVMRAGIRSLAHVQRYDLPGNFHLLIGRDVQVRAQLRKMLTDALLWAVVVVGMLATIGALVIRSLFNRTLSNISATTAAIAGGDLAQRVRLSGRGDEFDQVAEVINDMLERIGRLMDGVREVSNAIAHDLRTPITRARARLEDAVLHAATTDDLRAAIERATIDLDGIVAVFQALLRIAEIEAGSRRSSFTRLDLVPVLDDVTDLYSAVAEEREVRLETALPAQVAAYGDQALIQQAVANLLDNAVKFSPPGGVVRLAVIVGDQISIIVMDEGPGIPADDRQRATDRFFRGETARSTPGSGLGLSLVLAVANLHGGGLRLEDNHPGLRVVLTLPLPEDAELRRAANISQSNGIVTTQ
ncbi:MAG TPA: HAMP domain-containing sensor histidine kinase [Rhodopila sp.]|uniref:sensor histidine kinase n=1 Tax=Rhodopila sp. TaxID=2480087 RepID=UPI002C9C1124|nr:HAMP domain-containing sensor histidine kinase [Rhodopila sp.]HVY17017.1 HAMP domain-containing sensor histidine kinase [Rhodopila sp.]